MKHPSEIKAAFNSTIEQMARHCEDFARRPGVDFTRRRKISFANLIRLLVSMGAGSTRKELLEFGDFDPKAVPSNSAFCQQRAKLKDETMRQLLRLFSSRLDLGLYKRRYHLIACDGTKCSFGPDPDDPQTFYRIHKTARGTNLFHLTTLYDIIGDLYLDAIWQPHRQTDEYRAMVKLVDDFDRRRDAIFIADRGFASYNVFAHVVESGHLFVIRAKDINTKRIIGTDTLDDEMDLEVDLILTRSNTKRLGKSDRYRSIKTSFDFLDDTHPEYPLKLRIVRFPQASGFVNIVTNLAPGEFPASDIEEIYRLRWGIETSFRKLKYTVGAIRFHSKKVQMCAQELVGHLVLYDFCTAIIGLVENMSEPKKGDIYTHKTNFDNAVSVCRAFLKGYVCASDLKELIAGSSCPVRPGRAFKRRHRPHLALGYTYRVA